jgi:hypothetical protein
MIFQQGEIFPNRKIGRDKLACIGFVEKSGLETKKRERNASLPFHQF